MRSSLDIVLIKLSRNIYLPDEIKFFLLKSSLSCGRSWQISFPDLPLTMMAVSLTVNKKCLPVKPSLQMLTIYIGLHKKNQITVTNIPEGRPFSQHSNAHSLRFD